jgi:hypothetical protein
VPLVIAAEVRRIVVADLVPCLAGVVVLTDHEPSGLLKPQVLLGLEWTYRHDGLEVSMNPEALIPSSRATASIRSGLSKLVRSVSTAWTIRCA